MNRFLVSLSFILAFSFTNIWASSFGFNALGNEHLPINARQSAMGNSGMALINSGYSALNPASLDYNEQTHFSVSGGLEQTTLKKDDIKISDFTPNVNYISMNLPLGMLGHFGISYWRHYTKNFEVEIEYTDGNSDKFEFSGGIYNITPGWGFRFPGHLRRFSVGAAWHIVMGHDKHVLSYNSISQGDDLVDKIAGETSVTRRVDINTKPSSENPGYFTGSAQYHSKIVDVFVSYSHNYTIERRFTTTNIANHSDSLISSKTYVDQNIPMMIGTGAVFRPLPRMSISMDVFKSNWNDKKYAIANRDGFNVPSEIEANTALRTGLGLEWSGTGKFFDPMYKKMSYRMGFSYNDLYIGDIKEYMFSLGSGVPMGRRGSKMDFAIKGGLRRGSSDEMQENFWRLDFSFAGLGNWGKSSR